MALRGTLPLAEQRSRHGTQLLQLGLASRQDRLSLITQTIQQNIANDRAKKDQKTAERKQRQKGTLAAGLAVAGGVAGAFIGPTLALAAGPVLPGVEAAAALSGAGIGASVGGVIGQGFGAPNVGGVIGQTIGRFSQIAESRALRRLRQQGTDATANSKFGTSVRDQLAADGFTEEEIEEMLRALGQG